MITYEKIKQKKQKKVQLSTEEAVMDLERQLRAGTRFEFPSSVGISGDVIASRQIIYADSIKTLKRFVPSVDNVSKQQQVFSILVAPVVGHKDFKSDNPSVVGVLQMINKCDGRISDYDI